MAAYLPKSVEKVIEEFEKLPGIGPKSAARMAYHFLRSTRNSAVTLADALTEMNEKVVYCQMCFNVAEKEICDICGSPMRDSKKLCVVEEPLDVVAFEKSGIFNGLYFVLGGVISPADGVGPEELRFAQLRKRLSDVINDGVTEYEIIVATNPSLEGEATATYIQDTVRGIDKEGIMNVTRLAMGLPTGADLEYADRTTLKRALEGRRAL